MTIGDKRVFDPPPDHPYQPVRQLPVPYFSYVLIGVCVALFAYEEFVLRTPGSRHPSLGQLYGPLVQAGDWWRPVTFLFEHGSLLHLVLNMSVVWTLGTTLERAVGTWRFAVISLVTGLGSATFALLFNFQIHTVGASGMILGWGGAMLPIATEAGRRSLMTWLIQVVVISLIPGVSWAGHLGGFVFGLPCGFALKAGHGRFAYLAPVLVFVAAIATVLASHPEKLPRP